MENRMKICYKYKLKFSEKIESIFLREDEYFDPISESENYEDDAIPKYNDPREYLPEINKNKFDWDELIITESKESNKSIRTDYFADGESQLINRKDNNGYELVIQSFLIRPNEIYISRIERSGLDEPWKNTSFSLGLNFEGGKNEVWYDLKERILI